MPALCNRIPFGYARAHLVIYSRREGAQRWNLNVAEFRMAEKMIQVLDGSPDNIVACVATRRVTKADYDDVLIPRFEQALSRNQKVRCCYEIGADFSTFEPGGDVRRCQDRPRAHLLLGARGDRNGCRIVKARDERASVPHAGYRSRVSDL
jgi:hypothetical protein